MATRRSLGPAPSGTPAPARVWMVRLVLILTGLTALLPAPAADAVTRAGVAAAGTSATPAPAGSPATVAPSVPAGAPPLPSTLTAQAWLVADLDTGAVLAEQDAHSRRAPASTLKILTALALLPRVPPDRMLTPAYADIAIDGSRVGLVDTMAYSAGDLFRAMLMVSGNDAAMTLAGGVGGVDAAAVLMNDAARQVGAVDTHAVNPTGLDADAQFSSAYDLALIARAALARPDFRGYVATVDATIPAPGGTSFQIRNHNRLLTRYPGAIGVKNGYTVAARASFVGAATRDGHTLLVTLMTAAPAVQQEAAALLDWGFAAAGTVQPVDTLTAPVEVGSPSPAAPTRKPAAPTRGASALTSSDRSDTSAPALVRRSGTVGLVVTLLALITLVGLRRRAVVRSRARHRLR